MAGQARCLLCGREGLRAKLRTEKGLIAACPNCGLSQTVDGRSEADLAGLYDEGYALSQPARPDGVQRERYQRLLRLALERRPPPARLLEVGVGQGWLLAQAKEAGYEVLGADLSAGGAEIAAQSSGVRVLAGRLDQLGLADSSQEVILMRHVLEHLGNPLENLEEVRRILVPGGFLIGAVPNFNSLKRRLDGAEWFFLTLPHHRLHFTPRSLQSMLGRAGLKPARIRTAEHFPFHRAVFQVGLNRFRRLAGRPEAPIDYDPARIEVNSLVTWLLAQEPRLHRFLARVGLGEEIVFVAVKR
ncbi:MAG: class I SAM-dependent methyltransferase [Deltaproteobacteria bacterium]|nr:class I SAM-dependent methyltransferase [Deltaproteobacteria bacterium]